MTGAFEGGEQHGKTARSRFHLTFPAGHPTFASPMAKDMPARSLRNPSPAHRRAACLGLGVLAAAFCTALTTGAAADLPCDGLRVMALGDFSLHTAGIAGQMTFVSCRITLHMGLGFYWPWTINYNVLGLAGREIRKPGDLIGGVVRARLFFYLLDNAPSKLWVSPFFQTGIGFRSWNGVERPIGLNAGGLTVGWTFLLPEQWLISAGAGAQYHTGYSNDSFRPPGFALFSPAIDLMVGRYW